MSTVTCKYHPDAPARWVCRACHINYCPRCIHQAPHEQAPACPVCARALEPLGAGNAIEPFWHRLPTFFAYPLHPASLGMLLLFAALTLLSQVDVLGFVVMLVVGFGFMKYAYAALERVAAGHADPPGLAGASLAGELELPFKQVLVFFVLAFANFAIFDLFGRIAYGVGLGLTVLALPASVMVLAVERSFFRAFNPLTLGTFIARIGAPYFILCLFIALLLLGSSAAAELFAGMRPAWALPPAYSLIAMYFCLVMFAMMGYVVYQYHEQLGHAVEVDPGAVEAADEAPQGSPVLRQAEVLVKEGRYAEALHVLEQGARAAPTDFVLRDRLHKLLCVRAEPQRLVAHGRDYVTRLLLERRTRRAMAVYRDCAAADAACKPLGARAAVRLAEAFVASGDPRSALGLLSNFHQAYPDSPETPGAYLLAAHLMCDKYGQDQQARRVLDFVLVRYAHHPLAAEVRAYRDLIDSVSRSA